MTTNSNYIKATGKKDTLEKVTVYYYCNRSGFFSSESSGKRQPKALGTTKLNSYCTASITLHKYQNGSLCAEVCSTHYGHSFGLGQLRLPQSARIEIASKLSQGVSVIRILEDIRSSVTDSFNRTHITTKKDIANIERAFGLRDVERHPDDATSTALWVKELESRGESSPVLLFKQQGMEYKKYKHVNREDFILILQTPFQAVLLKKFGSNIICIDSTHKTTGYDFTLITVLVVDEYGEGYPVAWCLSNREDQALMIIFYTCLKDKCGEISPQWIMTDDAEQFYSAWVVVFDSQPHKLLCAWHIDRAWKTNLSKIKDKEMQCQVYHILRTLLEEVNVEKFDTALNNFVCQILLNKQTKEYGEYFKTYYYFRKEQWAACYRRHSGINTNMYVEAFHRTLKHIYFQGKTNKRVDKCMNVLLRIARDKAFERLTKLEKGKASLRISTIKKRHKQSLKMPQDMV